MKKSEIKLYNVLAPIWAVYWLALPYAWFLILPGNFIIDSIVLMISMYALKMKDKMRYYWRHIFSVFALGLVCDLLGSACMLLVNIAFASHVDGDELFLTIPGVIITSVLIYVANYYITFRKDEKSVRHKLSLTFAIATAPYLFLIPIAY